MMSEQDIRVYVGCPSHDGTIRTQTATSIEFASRRRVIKSQNTISLLTYNFNKLLCMAYNRRKEHGITHFAMIHADVAAEDWWADKMIAIMEERHLDVLSGIIPIKATNGDTSTALDGPDGVRRLNLFADLRDKPPTFTPRDCKKWWGNDKLLVNTGLLVIRLAALNPNRQYFSFEDRIVKNGDTYEATNFPEDWMFSRRLRRAGVRYGATRDVQIFHTGVWVWSNDVDQDRGGAA